MAFLYSWIMWEFDRISLSNESLKDVSEQLQYFCIAILRRTCIYSDGKEETAYWSTVGMFDVVMAQMNLY